MILGRSTTNSINEYDNVNFGITTEACDYTSIITDATEELTALESALFVADIMLEEKALEGATGQEMEVLLEGVMSSFFGRLKDVLKKLMAKIKQWFENIKKYFQILFTHGKEFAKKYKTDIIKAAAKCNGFKYKTYDFSIGWDSLAEMKDADTHSNGDIDAMNAAKAVISSNPNEKSTSELCKIYMEKEFWHEYKVDSQAEWNKEMKEELYGGSMEREEFEDFDKGPSVQSMLNILENGQKAISTLDRIHANLQKDCNKTVKEIEKVENEVAKELAKPSENGQPKGKLGNEYALGVEICKAVANHFMSIVDIYKEAIKVAMKDGESILKALLNHKPAKESFEGGFGDSENILESAFRFI